MYLLLFKASLIHKTTYVQFVSVLRALYAMSSLFYDYVKKKHICRRELRESGISGNASAIPEMPGIPEIAYAVLGI